MSIEVESHNKNDLMHILLLAESSLNGASVTGWLFRSVCKTKSHTTEVKPFKQRLLSFVKSHQGSQRLNGPWKFNSALRWPGHSSKS